MSSIINTEQTTIVAVLATVQTQGQADLIQESLTSPTEETKAQESLQTQALATVLTQEQAGLTQEILTNLTEETKAQELIDQSQGSGESRVRESQ